ncbi:MAG: hypothetical protein ABSE19_00480 [Candidatus Acidiferrum sp.]|jgi:hypothetical protein
MAKIARVAIEGVPRPALEETQNKPIAIITKATRMNCETRAFSFSELSARSKFQPHRAQKGFVLRSKNCRNVTAEPQRGHVMLLMNYILAAALAYRVRESASLRYPELLCGRTTTLAFLRRDTGETV